MTKAKRILTIILLLALLITIGGELFLALSVRTSAAEAVSHSNVLDDLSKDSKFNPEDYPAKADDYSLQVIQIAEGTNGELFVYVYQPSAETKSIVAGSIALSRSMDNLDYNKYRLQLVGQDGVFQKYKVNNLTASIDNQRYYIISSIYRPYDVMLDGERTDDNTVTEIALGVGQTWKVTELNGEISYEMDYEDLIRITSQYVEFLRYNDSFLFYSGHTDSHFIAFSTDKIIDDLLEVQVEFTAQVFTKLSYTLTSWNDRLVPGQANLYNKTYSKEEVFESSWWVVNSYKWNRIQTVEELKKTEDSYFSEETLSALEGKEWVLRFWETPYTSITENVGTDTIVNMQTTTTYHDVTDVALLRMKYMYRGKVYNLGVVADVQSGNSIPGGYVDPQGEEWWQKIMAALMIIIIIVAVIFLSGPLGLIFKLLWTGLKFLLSIVLGIIKIPFKIIGWLVKTK